MSEFVEKTAAQQLAGLAGVGAYEWRVAEDRLVWSPELVRIYGLERAPERERGFTERVHPDDRTRVEAETSAFMAAGSSYQHEFRIVRPDGEVRLIHDRGVIERAQNGSVVALRGVNVDITGLGTRLAHGPSPPEAAAVAPEGQGQLRLATEAARFGVYELDVRRQRSFWSPELLSILGRDGQSGVGSFEQALAHVHPDDRVQVRAAMEAALRRIGHFGLEYRIVLPDGTVRWVLDRGETFGPLDPDSGLAARTSGTLVDVTDRRMVEEALRRTEQRMRGIAEASPAILWEAAPDGTITYASDQWFRFCGITPAENARRWPELVLHPDDRERCEKAWRHALATGEDYEIEVRNRRADGVYRWFLSRARAVRDAKGAIIAWYGASSDIEELKRVEQALAETAESLARERERLAIALRAGRLGVYEWRVAETAIWWSPEIYHVFGVDPASFTPNLETFTALVHPEDREELWRQSRERLAQGEARTSEFRIIRPDGTVRWIEDRLQLKPDASGRVERVTGVAVDITERKQTEEHIRQLMHEVSHRSKNLLALVHAVARQTAAGDPQDFLERFGQRIQALAASHDLLVNEQWKGVELGKLVRSQLAHFADLIDTRIALRGPTVDLTAAAAQTVGMALHELATNAGKYGALSSQSGRVEIAWELRRSAANAQRLEITWVERGGPPVGMPARRGFGSTVIETVAGQTLGAAAEIDFAPGGVSWRLSCPEHCLLGGMAVDAGRRDAEMPPADPDPPGPGKRILVVEDEMLLALDLVDMIERAGHTVIGPAGRVRQALELIERHGCDAGLLDINLGAETSEPVAARLLADDVPFIALSGYSREQLPPLFRDAPQLSKPLRPELLVAALERCLAGSTAGS